MTSFTCLFDKPHKNYIAGDTITLGLKISVGSPFKARSLMIEFKGIGHTAWRQTHMSWYWNYVNMTYEIPYEYLLHTGNEEYCKHSQYLLGGPNSSAIEVTTGVYSYSFTFKLPNDAPTNIEHKYGHIRYSVNVKATYDVPRWFNKKGTASFYVTANVDLNDDSYSHSPIRELEEKIFGCFCWTSNSMKLVNILPRGGFVLGEVIPIIIEVINDSNVWINSVRVKLKEQLTFNVDTRTDTKILKEHNIQTSVAPFHKKIFKTQLNLDPRYAYKINHRGIIKCDYYITTVAVSSGCHTNCENNTRIVIGTIPFTTTVTNQNVIPDIPVEISQTFPVEILSLIAPRVIEQQPQPTLRQTTFHGSFDQPTWTSERRDPFGATPVFEDETQC